MRVSGLGRRRVPLIAFKVCKGADSPVEPCRFWGEVMRTIFCAAVGAALFSSPAAARDWQDQQVDFRPSAFAGGQVRLPIGGSSKTNPSAQLTIAPARSAIDGSGILTTRIGDGVGLEFASKRPQLTFAGSPAKKIANARHKMGISTVAWVGIGMAVAAVGGFLIWADKVRDSGD